MKAIITNALWLMLERVSLSLSGIFVSIYVARYLGPAQFGALNYLLATIAIVVPLVQLGADSIIFNRVARRQPSGIRLPDVNNWRLLLLPQCVPILIWSYFSLKHDACCLSAPISRFRTCTRFITMPACSRNAIR
ncbi:oligosaccharide flippase family protein [Serratia marcescens]|nr:oligosaccharide flippase family protein [Serratia marcescens]